MADDDPEVRTICISGCVLFGLLLALALWRSTVLVRACGWLPLTARKLFHLCITVLSAFKLSEFVYMWQFGNLLEKSTSMLGRFIYGLHLLCYWLQLCALSIVVTLWAGALRQERRHRPGQEASSAGPSIASESGAPMTPLAQEGAKHSLSSRIHSCMHNKRAVVCFLVALDGAVLLYTIVVAGFILEQPGNKSIVNIAAGYAWYRAFGWVAGLALLFTACGILFYGLSITARIIFRSDADPNYYSLKLRRMVWRLNTSMAVCCSAFALRCFLLLFFSVKGEKYVSSKVTELEWYVMLDWIPTIVPSVVLLYLMRRPDSNGRSRARQPGPSQAQPTARSSSSPERDRNSLRRPLMEGSRPTTQGP